MIKRWAVVAFVFLFLQGQVFAGSSVVDKAPEKVVKEFYVWYITKQNSSDFPLLDPGIYDYVSANTVKKLRADYSSDRLDDADYFTKVQDYDPGDWIKNIDVGRPVVAKGGVRIPVHFGSVDKVDVLVYVAQEAGVWKIVKVGSVESRQLHGKAELRRP